MHYLELLARLHGQLAPKTYLEIGIRNGDSLALSRSDRSIGIDPEFTVTSELRSPTTLIRSTSDAFFDALGPRGPFKGSPIDLAFIDGMHLSEFALRDFINVERFASPSTVVVFDDILPRDVDEAARDRHTQAWTGDVFKLVDVFQTLRPDLGLILVDTQPTGLLLITDLDPTSTVLDGEFDQLVAEFVTPDPQTPSREILERRHAASPEAALSRLATRKPASQRRSGIATRVRSRRSRAS